MSWQAQNFIVITLLLIQLEQMKFPSNSYFWNKHIFWMIRIENHLSKI